jgi:hypothetical protein
MKWLAVCLAAGAAATTAALGQQAYRLRDTYRPGDLSHVDTSMDMTMSIQATANGEQAPLLFFGRRDREKYSEQVLAVDSRGPSGVRRTYTVARGVDTDPNGSERKKVYSLQGKTVVLRRKGDQTAVSVTRGKISAEDQKSLQRSLKQSDMDMFPDRDVAPGEEWLVDPQVMSAAVEGMDKAEIRCRFQEIVPFAGRQCARVQVTMEMAGQPAGVPGPMTVKLSGDAYHALDLKRTIAVELSGPITMTGQKSENGLNIRFTGEGTMRLKETRRWLKVAGKPVAVQSTDPTQ